MLYLAYIEGLGAEEPVEGPWAEVFVLRPGLLLVDSEHGRSAVYHALKDQRPSADGALLVAALDEVPKLTRMAPGALAFARARLGG